MVKKVGKKGIRSFTVDEAKDNKGCPTKFYNKDYTGRYLSKNHASAAKKAATQLCRVKRIKGTCTLYVDMVETTQGSKKKVLKYKLTRKKLKEEGPFGNKYEVIARSLNKNKSLSKNTPNCKSGKKKSKGRKVSRTTKGKNYLGIF